MTSLLTTDLVRAVHQATSAEALLQATRELADSGDPQGASCLVQVLGFNNPGAAVAAVEGLIRLGEPAVQAILRQLDDRNYGARAWAVRALAGIGDVRGLELLEEALATDVGPSVRRAAACGLGRLRLEALSEGERQSTRERCLQALQAGKADAEWVVRYAVSVGLESLGGPLRQSGGPLLESAIASLAELSEACREETLVVRLRARLALRRLRP